MFFDLRNTMQSCPVINHLAANLARVRGLGRAWEQSLGKAQTSIIGVFTHTLYTSGFLVYKQYIFFYTDN